MWALTVLDRMSSEFEIVESLERELATKKIRRDRARMDILLHDDFSEIGKSGRIFDKKTLLAEVPSGDCFEITLSNFIYHDLAKDVIMLKYKSIVGGIKAYRTSIWVKEKGLWQMLHHQGTICS